MDSTKEHARPCRWPAAHPQTTFPTVCWRKRGVSFKPRRADVPQISMSILFVIILLKQLTDFDYCQLGTESVRDYET